MEDAIIAAMNEIREHKMDHVKNAVLSVPDRMQKCIQMNGVQLQHL
jgi:hypothetical protein